MKNRKFNINIGKSNITLEPKNIKVDNESPNESLEEIPVIKLNISKIKYDNAVKDCIKNIFREHNIKVKDPDIVDEISKNVYEHFMIVLQRENSNIFIEEIES